MEIEIKKKKFLRLGLKVKKSLKANKLFVLSTYLKKSKGSLVRFRSLGIDVFAGEGGVRNCVCVGGGEVHLISLAA